MAWGVAVYRGEVGRTLDFPLAGRRVAAERRMASARVGTRLGGDLVPKPGPHAGVSACQGTGRGLRTCAPSCVNDFCLPGVWS